MDFGLAKAFVDESPDADSSMSPTITRDATRVGVIMGTAAYMSPEQAKGKEVDKRADVWAFGAVLYEMLAGKKAFAGDDVSDTLAAVLRAEVDWRALPADVTARMAALLRRCLAKNSSERWRDIGDVKFELGNEETEEVSTEVTTRRHWGVLVVGALLVAAGSAAIAWNLKPEAPRPVSRFSVYLSEDENFSYAGRRIIAFSPDGTRIAYVANRQLYLRALDDTEAVRLADTQGARTPFFSPDGEWLGFYADGGLYKVSVRGGPRVRICDALIVYGASWADDGNIMFGQGARGIWHVSAEGGDPEVLVDVEDGEMAYGPQPLPGGRHVLYSVSTSRNWDEARIEARSLKTSETKVLIRGGSDVRYVATGHLLYAVDETILAVPFDPDTLEVKAGPVPVVEGVGRAFNQTAAAHASFSQTGALAFVAQDQIATRTLVWVDRSGRVGEPLVEPGSYIMVASSPDGSRVALTRGGPEVDIWILDVARTTLTRLTTEGAEYPAWSPDGEWIAFSSRDGLYRIRSDFSGAAEPLLEKDGTFRSYAYSPDGKWLIYGAQTDGVQFDLWALPLQENGEPQPLMQTLSDERDATLSPDGRYMAYVSDESGGFDVYVTPFPDSGRKWPISIGGGRGPQWSADGREISYLESGGSLSKMMTARVETLPEFTSKVPEVVFEMPTMDRPQGLFSATPDRERFVMLRDVNTESGRAHFKVVLNWFEELERLLPTDP